MRAFSPALCAFAAVLGCGDDPGPVGVPVSEPSVASAIAAPLTFTQVSAGGHGAPVVMHACGVTAGNQVYCWGNNYFGELGLDPNLGPESCVTDYGTFPCSSRPLLIGGGYSFRQVSVGGHHTCGVATDNRAYCWGPNFYGQLGDGTTTPRLTPTPVAGGMLYRQVDAGYLHTCGLTTDNRAYCWGYNADAELGDGTSTIRLAPVAVSGDRAFRQVSAGAYHSCGVTTSDVAFCWGRNLDGQVGDGTTAARRFRPRRVVGTRPFKQIDAADFHTCAVTISGRAFCWGGGDYGNLGNGKTSTSLEPRAVSGELSFERVSAGSTHTCGETPTNQAYCWGTPEPVGSGSPSFALTPTAVAGGYAFSQVSAGHRFTCARTPKGVVYCWGFNFEAQLGDGTTEDRRMPTPVAGPA